jgi:SH3 domain protein
MTYRFLCGALLLLLAGNAVAGEFVYISDMLYVQLRATPTESANILHAGLRSGTELELLSTDLEAGFSHVRMNDGTEGWIPSQYLVAQPIASDRLDAAERKVADLERENSALNTKVDALSRENVQLRQRGEAVLAEAKEAKRAFEELQRISSSAVKLDRHNRAVNELNALLRREVDSLVTENQNLARASRQRWMLTGVGLLAIGIALGAFLMRRRRSW